MYTFYIWVTMMSRNVERLLTDLIEEKYAVSSATGSGDLTLMQKGNPAGLLAIKATIEPTSKKKKYECSDITDVISASCKKHGLKYYSIVVWEVSGSGCWNIGNINLDEIDKSKIAVITVKTEETPT